MSVNAGVPASGVAVDLPDVRSLARAAAICDSAGLPPDETWGTRPPSDDAAERVRAEGWCVDAEAAFRFCPIQVADLWTQCFMWWDDEPGAGFCVDTRLGFGGAYAVNRFERVTTLVAAHMQARQSAFDEAQPPPYSTQIDGGESHRSAPVVERSGEPHRNAVLEKPLPSRCTGEPLLTTSLTDGSTQSGQRCILCDTRPDQRRSVASQTGKS